VYSSPSYDEDCCSGGEDAVEGLKAFLEKESLSGKEGSSARSGYLPGISFLMSTQFMKLGVKENKTFRIFCFIRL